MKYVISVFISFVCGILFAYFLLISYANENNYCELAIDQAVKKYANVSGENPQKMSVMTGNGIVSFSKLTPDVMKKIDKDFLMLKDKPSALPFVSRYNLLIIKDSKVQSQLNFFTCGFEPPML